MESWSGWRDSGFQSQSTDRPTEDVWSAAGGPTWKPPASDLLPTCAQAQQPQLTCTAALPLRSAGQLHVPAWRRGEEQTASQGEPHPARHTPPGARPCSALAFVGLVAVAKELSPGEGEGLGKTRRAVSEAWKENSLSSDARETVSFITKTWGPRQGKDLDQPLESST